MYGVVAAMNKATQFQNLINFNMENEISKTEQPCTIHSVSSRLFHVHNDIEDAAKWYKIPIALYDRNDDVYIMQEDRCVFVGKPQQAVQFMKRNEGKYCKGRFPL
jgi:5-keto 4-deoxyuronate isomerase